MIRRLALFAILLSVISIGLYAKPDNNDHKFNWVEIYSLKNLKGVRSYYDSNSFTTTRVKKGNYNTVSLLVSFDTPRKMVVDNKEILVSSIMKSIIGECNLDILAPVYDLYFDTKKPGPNSIPIIGIEYPLNESTEVFQLSKSKIFQQYLCPTTI
jgi:hypothetical protein